jgi:WD40 repeat protein
VNLHGPVRAAGFEGTAKVTISLDAWPEGKVASTTHDIPVLPPKTGRKAEPVTTRLIRTLPHPDRKATIGVVQFSPDGSRLLMAGYPSGIVQVWDAKYWKETARVDTPGGLRSSWSYAVATADWKAVLVHVKTRKLVREEKDGKIAERLKIDGRIDRYDLATGELKDSIPFADRGPNQLFLAPGGRFALVNTEGSFTAAMKTRPQFMERVDLTTRETKKLFDVSAWPSFSPDGKTAYLSKTQFHTTGAVTASLVKYDLAAGKELRVLNQPDDKTLFDSAHLSPDGKWVVTSQRKLTPPSVNLLVLSADTLEEVARIPGPKDAGRDLYFSTPHFTPDGSTLITRCGGPLIVWDVKRRKTVRTVPVGDFQFAYTALSPDGKRAVVAGLPKLDSKVFGRSPDPTDLPQPRLVLIDLADPKSEPQTLMLPVGAVIGLAFRPDGAVVAVGGTGGVHLLDASGRR